MSNAYKGKKTKKQLLLLSTTFPGDMLLEIAVSLFDVLFINFYKENFVYLTVLLFIRKHCISGALDVINV